MKPYLITAAGSDVLTLAKAKEHLGVDHTAHDASLIPDLIKAAQTAWEEDSGRVLLDSTWEQAYENWPTSYFEIDKYPLTSITSIKYTGEDGVEQTLSTGVYLLSALPNRRPRIYLKNAQTWPSVTLQVGYPIRIRFKVGDATAAEVPQDIMAAIKVKIGDLYMDRDGMAEVRARSGQLIGSERVWRWATMRYRIEA